MRALRHSCRLVGVAFVLAREGALFALEELHLAPVARSLAWVVSLGVSRRGSPGQRLAKACERLGPSFIKLGQALSTRSDLVGDQLARDLSSLQDHVPPFPAARARQTIEQELGAPVDALFTEFDDKPVAAASIAQVHRARTPEGMLVAVKVLRPNIEQAFARDIDFFLWLATLMERTHPMMKRLKPVEVVAQMAESVRLEMDLRFEAAAAAELKANFAGDDSFKVPDIDWKRTARRVLVTEWVEGINVAEKQALIAAGYDIDQLLANSSAVMFKQVFRDGFFHADMHPGNVFIGAGGKIIVVDFGIMGRVSRETRMFLAQTLQGFLNRDYRKVAEVHFAHGFVPPHKSVEAFAQACRSIGEPIMGLPLNEISVGKLLGQLFKIAEDFDMETDPSLFLLHKTLMMSEGVGRMLNPNVNMWQLAEPLIAQWARENFGAEAMLRERVKEFRRFADKLSRLLDKADLALEKYLKDQSN